MAWFKKPQYTKLAQPKMRDRIPQGLMVKCENCFEKYLKEDYENNLWVCPKCNHHGRIGSRQRIAITFDSFEEDNTNLRSTDPLQFVAAKTYADQLKTYVAKSGLTEAVVTGVGEIEGFRVSTAVMDFNFIGGSMGSVVGEKITRAIERGISEKLPVIVFCCSGGARMQEGILSLMQMAKTSSALGRLGEAGMPYISVLTNPTTAGVMASYASLGDVIISEPGCMVGFAGPRVIQETIREILPKGFQTAEFVRDKGFIDRVIHRKDMKRELANCLSFLSGQVSPKYKYGEAGVIDAKDVV